MQLHEVAKERGGHKFLSEMSPGISKGWKPATCSDVRHTERTYPRNGLVPRRPGKGIGLVPGRNGYQTFPLAISAFAQGWNSLLTQLQAPPRPVVP